MRKPKYLLLHRESYMGCTFDKAEVFKTVDGLKRLGLRGGKVYAIGEEVDAELVLKLK